MLVFDIIRNYGGEETTTGETKYKMERRVKEHVQKRENKSKHKYNEFFRKNREECEMLYHSGSKLWKHQ